MKTGKLVLAAAYCLLLGGQALAQAGRPGDGAIVGQEPCGPHRYATHEQYVEAVRTGLAGEVEAARREGLRFDVPPDLTPLLLSKAEFEKRKAYVGFECQRITYMSDGLKVVGYLWKPKDAAGKKLPLIIYNRGGNREFGKLSPWAWSGFYEYLSNGFVVVASQYRGNDGGEGKEEFGGADVRDVLNLVPLARGLGYVDMNNLFLFGWSRGGMHALLARKERIPVNAAAVGGVAADLIAGKEKRPGMVEVYTELIPDFAARGDEALRERSAVYWPEKIGVPLLILHGGADWRSDVGANALALAQKLGALRRTYELHVYADDDHSIFRNSADGDRRVIAWFRRYMR